MPLFVGGPLDGKLIDVDPSRDGVEVAIEHPFPVNHPAQKPSKYKDMFFYKREVLQCPTMEVVVFVPRSYTCADLMTALIEGYHQNALQNT